MAHKPKHLVIRILAVGLLSVLTDHCSLGRDAVNEWSLVRHPALIASMAAIIEGFRAPLTVSTIETRVQRTATAVTVDPLCAQSKRTLLAAWTIVKRGRLLNHSEPGVKHAVLKRYQGGGSLSNAVLSCGSGAEEDQRDYYRLG